MDAGPYALDVEVTGQHPAVLRQALEPACRLAVWQRPRPQGLSALLDSLEPWALPETRLRLRAIEVPWALEMACQAAGMPVDASREAFVADVGVLASLLSAISGCGRLRLRLEVTADDACRRWHRDCVHLRLLCTYRGPGTQWVDAMHGDDAFGNDGYAGPFHSLATHDVALYRGCGRDPGLHRSSLVHRSPPIAGQGIARLLLCLDAEP